jgi:hypothetical protein
LFFFEKKNQKTSIHYASRESACELCHTAGGRGAHSNKWIEVFCFFFQKEALPYPFP